MQFMKNYSEVVQATKICIDQRLLMPSLILLYSTIDSLAWATSDKQQKVGVRERFERWIEKWIGEKLSCTATDLYAARCGVLHTLTSKADLTLRGEAREIAYAWGSASSDELQEVIDRVGNKKVVALHLDALFQLVRNAMADMFEQAEKDETLAQSLNEAAALHFVHQDPQIIKSYLKLVRGEEPAK